MASTLSRLRQPFVSAKSPRSLQGQRNASTLLYTVKPSRHEIFAGRLGSHHLEVAVRSLHEDGLVIVSIVIPHENLDHLNTKMVQDAHVLQACGKDSPFNYNPGNIICDDSNRWPIPPPTAFNSNRIRLQSKLFSTAQSS